MKTPKTLQYLLVEHFVIVNGEHVFCNHSKCDVKFKKKNESH